VLDTGGFVWVPAFGTTAEIGPSRFEIDSEVAFGNREDCNDGFCFYPIRSSSLLQEDVDLTELHFQVLL